MPPMLAPQAMPSKMLRSKAMESEPSGSPGKWATNERVKGSIMTAVAVLLIHKLSP